MLFLVYIAVGMGLAAAVGLRILSDAVALRSLAAYAAVGLIALAVETASMLRALQPPPKA